MKGTQMLGYFTAKDKKNDSSEHLLLEQISNGDQDAFAELYDRYATILYGVLKTIIKRHEEVEDLHQLIFIKIWEKASFYDHRKGSPYSWILTLTRNIALDRIKSKYYRRARESFVEFNEFESECSARELSILDSTIEKEKSKIVNNALMKIPAEQSTVIELAYYEGMTQSQMSQELNIPLGTIKTRMRQGLIKLEKTLNPLFHLIYE